MSPKHTAKPEDFTFLKAILLPFVSFSFVGPWARPLSLENVLHLDSTLVLERQAEGIESCRLKGADPSSGNEAKEALRDGKVPTRAHFHLSQAEKSFSFAFNADTLATSGVKIPQLLTDKEDDGFFERMQLIEELETLLLSLFEQFVRLRLSTEWDATVVPALRLWVRDEPCMTRADYESLRDRMAIRQQKPRSPLA